MLKDYGHRWSNTNEGDGAHGSWFGFCAAEGSIDPSATIKVTGGGIYSCTGSLTDGLFDNILISSYYIYTVIFVDAQNIYAPSRMMKRFF